jgi:hypothetical protein
MSGAGEFGAESLGPEEHARCMKEEGDRLVRLYRRLLKEGEGHTREEVAEAFVRSGTTFCKGPFRMHHFTHEEQHALPTNKELADSCYGMI